MFANSRYRSTHFLACASMSHDHEEIRRFSEHVNFFSCSCGNSGFKHGSAIVNNIFAYFALPLSTPQVHMHLCSSGSSPAHPTGFRGAPRGEHLSTRSRLSVKSPCNGPVRFPQHLFSVPRSRTATLGQGPQHLSCPDVGLTVHRAVSVRRGTTGR